MHNGDADFRRFFSLMESVDGQGVVEILTETYSIRPGLDADVLLSGGRGDPTLLFWQRWEPRFRMPPPHLQTLLWTLT